MYIHFSIKVAVCLISVFTSLCLAYSGSGTGTDDHPYQIADVNDLLELADTLADYSSCFILTDDIDLAGHGFTRAVIAWDTAVNEPGFQGTAFTGVFDGNDHTIYNMTIHATGQDYMCLIGSLGGGGQIKNLRIVNAAATGRYNISSLTGDNHGTISHCRAEGFDLNAHAQVGAFCGINYGTIESCYAADSGTVWGNAGNAGGICGYNVGTIRQCCAACPVSSNTTYAMYTGGLSGYAGGTMTLNYANNAVTGKDYVGGLCGYIHAGSVNQCYASGTVTGQNGIGGLCGMFSYSSMTHCYSAGRVNGISNVGGLCGGRTSGIDTASFWDIDTSGQGTSVCGTGKSTQDMKKAITFTGAGWDFSDSDGDPADWMMLRETEDYPRLFYQEIIPGDIAGLYGVSGIDLVELAANWLHTNCPDACEDADIDRNGIVNFLDYTWLALMWLE